MAQIILCTASMFSREINSQASYANELRGGMIAEIVQRVAAPMSAVVVVGPASDAQDPRLR